jgi:hypothetical protein
MTVVLLASHVMPGHPLHGIAVVRRRHVYTSMCIQQKSCEQMGARPRYATFVAHGCTSLYKEHQVKTIARSLHELKALQTITKINMHMHIALPGHTRVWLALHCYLYM